jgi:microcystin-dependent protein
VNAMIAILFLVAIVVLFDIVATQFGADSRETFADPRYQSGPSI